MHHLINSVVLRVSFGFQCVDLMPRRKDNSNELIEAIFTLSALEE